MSSTFAVPAIDKPGQLTAMISSTALDLPEHRAAVKEACIAAGIFPIGMEHLPARDATGIQVSLEMVDKADIYLGIYAWRYGWVPDGKDIETGARRPWPSARPPANERRNGSSAAHLPASRSSFFRMSP